MAQREVTVGSSVGLHARPAALFVKAAAAQPVPVRVGKPGTELVDARSILSVLSLDARGGDAIVLEAEGDGADEVLDVLAALVASDLDADGHG